MTKTIIFSAIIAIVLSATVAIAKAEPAHRGKCSAVAKAAKKTPADPAAKKPSRQTITAITITYEGSRKPVSMDSNGNATYHADMLPVMRSVDLSQVPSDTSIATKHPAGLVESHVVMRLVAFTDTTPNSGD